MTYKGHLLIGVEVAGMRHTAFEMRMPTLLDVEKAIEEAGKDASGAKVSRYKWARCLLSLGELPKESITPELLGTLAAVEYGVFQDAEVDLGKKLILPSETPPQEE